MYKRQIYAVTGYRELETLAHDPLVSSDVQHSFMRTALDKAGPVPDLVEAYGPPRSMIASDPPDHDRMRRMAMRHFGPPDSPDIIPSMEGECIRIVNDLLDKARGKTRMDVVDEYGYLLPVTIICKIMGVPLKDEPQIHKWVADTLAGIDFGPEAATDEGKAR